jgi:hypothetical protein
MFLLEIVVELLVVLAVVKFVIVPLISDGLVAPPVQARGWDEWDDDALFDDRAALYDRVLDEADAAMAYDALYAEYLKCPADDVYTRRRLYVELEALYPCHIRPLLISDTEEDNDVPF